MPESFESVLEKDGVLVYKTKGVSMQPLLKEGRDVVIIRPVTGRLKKYDVPLYRRREQYVLHRIISVKEDGYVIRGDNTYNKENVSGTDVIGVLDEFIRKGKKHSVNEPGYRFYAAFWNFIYPLRLLYVKFRYVLKRILKKQ